MTVDLGEGARAVLARPCRGTVVAVYRRAAYLRLAGEIGSDIVALVDASLAAGPLHLRCAVLPPLRAGQPVAGDGTRLAGGPWALRVDGSRVDATREQEVRGVVIKREQLDLGAWARALTAELREAAQTSEQARAALQRLVG